MPHSGACAALSMLSRTPHGDDTDQISETSGSLNLTGKTAATTRPQLLQLAKTTGRRGLEEQELKGAICRSKARLDLAVQGIKLGTASTSELEEIEGLFQEGDGNQTSHNHIGWNTTTTRHPRTRRLDRQTKRLKADDSRRVSNHP